MNRRVTAILLCGINWAVLVLFIVARQPSITHEEERDLTRRSESPYIFRDSGDPLTHIAGRPLYSWNSWHGGEDAWVQAAEVANAPSLALAHVAAPFVATAFSGDSYYFESWVKAWIFAFLSSAQWIVVGIALTRVLERRAIGARRPETSD